MHNLTASGTKIILFCTNRGHNLFFLLFFCVRVMKLNHTCAIHFKKNPKPWKPQKNPKTLKTSKLQGCRSTGCTPHFIFTFGQDSPLPAGELQKGCGWHSPQQEITQLKLQRCFFIVISGIPGPQNLLSRDDILSFLLVSKAVQTRWCLCSWL